MAILFCFSAVVCAYLAGYIMRYCVNPYYLHLVVGSKGSGKSLYMAKAANDWMKNNKGPVYSNMGIGLPLREEYWRMNFPPDSLILIDEIGVIHPDRGFKTFPTECMEWYKMSRKRHLTIILSSQVMDMDKKIRMLCDKIFLCHKAGWLCVLTPYRACISMVQTQEGGHDLVNDIKRSGSRKFYTIPKTATVTERLGYDTKQIIQAPPQEKGKESK